MYATGGLEPAYEDDETIEIDGFKYRTNDRFRSAIRESLIDWGTFKEVYEGTISNEILFDRINQILNLKPTPGFDGMLVEILKTLYELPASVHVEAVFKQKALFEPLSAAIKLVFDKFKEHYEIIVEQYILARNKYIESSKLPDKLNDFSEFVQKSEEFDKKYNLQSSSPILLFINPPNGLKSHLHIQVESLSQTQQLRKAIKKFHYPGFCPRVPKERLAKLLDFPLMEFVSLIQLMDPEITFPDYRKISHKVEKLIRTAPEKPEIEDQYKRKTPPELGPSETLQWYIEEILNMRKTLVDEAKKYTIYYNEQAKLFVELAGMLDERLKN